MLWVSEGNVKLNVYVISCDRRKSSLVLFGSRKKRWTHGRRKLPLLQVRKKILYLFISQYFSIYKLLESLVQVILANIRTNVCVLVFHIKEWWMMDASSVGVIAMHKRWLKYLLIWTSAKELYGRFENNSAFSLILQWEVYLALEVYIILW